MEQDKPPDMTPKDEIIGGNRCGGFRESGHGRARRWEGRGSGRAVGGGAPPNLPNLIWD